MGLFLRSVSMCCGSPKMAFSLCNKGFDLICTGIESTGKIYLGSLSLFHQIHSSSGVSGRCFLDTLAPHAIQLARGMVGVCGRWSL